MNALEQVTDLYSTGQRNFAVINANGSGLYSNGKIIVANDLIFGITIFDGEAFVPLTEALPDQIRSIRGTIKSEQPEFPWWEKFETTVEKFNMT